MASRSAIVPPQVGPIFTAISPSARQLYVLLKCIAFAPKALVQLNAEGLRFTVNQTSATEALSFLSSDLFTSFVYNPPPIRQRSPFDQAGENDETENVGQAFEINLPAFLETLQIFSVTDPSSNRFNKQDPYSALPSTAGGAAGAFSSTVLGMTGLCKISYESPGSPLEIVMEETGVRTTCELTTYEPETYTEDIPFMRSALQLKIILPSTSLHDAFGELASTQPERLTFAANEDAESFEMSAEGPLGSANVEFNNSENAKIMETFSMTRARVAVGYKFSLLHNAARAMAVANKVSLRIDEQGVLSLQFMMELENNAVSFIDFRFVPLVTEGGDDDVNSNTEDEE